MTETQELIAQANAMVAVPNVHFHYSDGPKLVSALVAAIEHLVAERDAAVVARFARLDGIVSRIRWTDVGIPATDHEGTRSALDDLAQYLFASGLDRAARNAGSGE